MSELKFDDLPSHTLDELKTAQKVLSKELRRKKAEAKEEETLKKLAAKHGYKLVKEPGKPDEKKPEDKPADTKPAVTAPFKL